MSFKNEYTVVGYLEGKGFVSVVDIARDNRMSIGKVYAICKNSDVIRQKREGDKTFFKNGTYSDVCNEVVSILKRNDMVSIEDMCKTTGSSRGEIYSICMNNKNISKRNIYGVNGRVTLFKFNDV